MFTFSSVFTSKSHLKFDHQSLMKQNVHNVHNSFKATARQSRRAQRNRTSQPNARRLTCLSLTAFYIITPPKLQWRLSVCVGLRWDQCGVVHSGDCRGQRRHSEHHRPSDSNPSPRTAAQHQRHFPQRPQVQDQLLQGRKHRQGLFLLLHFHFTELFHPIKQKIL